ncbi:hypothetical protein [Roseibium alexandrii]|uniref:hypothetical protein n=1 Tax=Roseibium alexandrii TaxID=388408 RepID=UPI003750F288
MSETYSSARRRGLEDTARADQGVSPERGAFFPKGDGPAEAPYGWFKTGRPVPFSTVYRDQFGNAIELVERQLGVSIEDHNRRLSETYQRGQKDAFRIMRNFAGEKLEGD